MYPADPIPQTVLSESTEQMAYRETLWELLSQLPHYQIALSAFQENDEKRRGWIQQTAINAGLSYEAYRQQIHRYRVKTRKRFGLPENATWQDIVQAAMRQDRRR